jgi:hypothetical protein
VSWQWLGLFVFKFSNTGRSRGAFIVRTNVHFVIQINIVTECFHGKISIPINENNYLFYSTGVCKDAFLSLIIPNVKFGI